MRIDIIDILEEFGKDSFRVVGKVIRRSNGEALL